MIDLYYAPTPNGWKISIMLEELGVPYTVVPVNIRAGDQFKPDFLAISPNNRIPAIVDHAPADGGEPFRCSILSIGKFVKPVIPGCATWRRPGIHNHDREYGFRARAPRAPE